MFKPKKIAKYCKDCGKPVTIKIFPIKYDSETGRIIREMHIAHCWNASYADIDWGKHYHKSWYITL